MAKVKNINGTSESTTNCKCGSWIKHWDNYGEYFRPKYCIIKGCNETNLVGAHVQKVDKSDNKWYIAPICNGHNNKKNEEFEIPSFELLAPANKSETCEK